MLVSPFPIGHSNDVPRGAAVDVGRCSESHRETVVRRTARPRVKCGTGRRRQPDDQRKDRASDRADAQRHQKLHPSSDLNDPSISRFPRKQNACDPPSPREQRQPRAFQVNAPDIVVAVVRATDKRGERVMNQPSRTVP
jgi:hypothetical protein